MALIDSHVHFHPSFRVDDFFEAASRNFDRAERELGLAPSTDDRIATPRPARVLLLMETAEPTLVETVSGGTSGAWATSDTTEPGTLVVERQSRQPLIVVEGRQVVTVEGLEVLATPCAAQLEPGLSLEETIAAVIELGAVPILPWGVGKWLGARGRRIATLLESPQGRRILLGDNGGRLAIGWTPRLLTLGAQRGIAVVRGSDPLPMASECERVASFGSLLPGPFERARPASSVRRALAGAVGIPRAFGRGAGPLAFVGRQLRAQLAKRMGGGRR